MITTLIIISIGKGNTGGKRKRGTTVKEEDGDGKKGKKKKIKDLKK